MNGWIGIDPGSTGALAVIRDDGFVVINDWPGDERAVVNMLHSIDWGFTIVGVVVEHQQSRPNQNCSSTFKQAMNYATWLTAVAFMRWPLRVVRPEAWKKGFGYPGKDKARKGVKGYAEQFQKESKAYSLTLARRMYPQADKYLTRVMDHNRAEALLLAHICKEVNNG